MLSHIPPSIFDGIRTSLGIENLAFEDFSFAGGGCINHAGKLKTGEGYFFLKWNDAKKFPGMFEVESKGLKFLRDQQTIKIPEVIGFGETTSHQFLLLEYIDENSRQIKYWEQLGNRLAALHRCSEELFGLNHNNYIGSLRQFNHQQTSWITFFIEQRLNVQLKLAIDSGKIDSQWVNEFESLYTKLPALLPEEKPSLLHGDLWSGNLITDDLGEPCLIDPAVYFGNREADLAMTKLFGGFEDAFYTSYHETFPLQPECHERFQIYNLYPLLVHVNLFGGSYKSAVANTLKAFR